MPRRAPRAPSSLLLPLLAIAAIVAAAGAPAAASHAGAPAAALAAPAAALAAPQPTAAAPPAVDDEDEDYTQRGPCRPLLALRTLVLPPETGCAGGAACTLSLRLHLPTACPPGVLAPGAAAPVVFLFPGFELSASLYTPYAKRLAGHGVAVVAYNSLHLLPLTPERVELAFLPHLMRALRGDAALAPRLRLQPGARVGVAGHSRGAKIAALHFASGAVPPAPPSGGDDGKGEGDGEGGVTVAAAFLIDPVDSSAFAPPSRDDPSAVEALRGRNLTAGVAAAGVGGPCNPAAANYAHFWDVLAPGSWLETVPAAGHLQFANLKGVLARALDFVCRHGAASHEHVIGLAAPALVAWMKAELADGGGGGQVAWRQQRAQQGRGVMRAAQRPLPPLAPPPARPATNGPLEAFYDWVRREESMGEITWRVKGA